jgi:energy-coupling factor transporter ATP-binding protein EcfA2
MTQVFDQLQISGYRGFEVIDLPQLGQVNIFVGNNNSGKTSLLEAVSILCNPLDPFQWFEISQRRLYLGRSLASRPDLEAMKWIFPQKVGSSTSESYQGEILIKSSGSAPIRKLEAKLEEIYGVGLEKGGRGNSDDTTGSETDAVIAGVELDIIAYLISEQVNLFSSDPEPSREVFQFWEKERFVLRRRNKPLVKSATIFPSYVSSEPILDRLSRVILEDGKNEVLELIRSFDDDILDFQILSTPRATLYIEHKELGFAPLYVFGDGFKRTLVIALTLITTARGVLLVDEIETSIHVSALGRVFSWLIETCRSREIQLALPDRG